MATVLKKSWRHWVPTVSGRPLVVWSGLAGGSGFVAGYWVCTRLRKPPQKSVDVDVHGWQWFAEGMAFVLGLVAAGTLLTRRFFYPNPETVLRSVLPKLRASREVCDLIGRQLEPGLFRAYSRYGGVWQWAGPPAIIGWKPRCLELMFQVNGEVSSGMVSADVSIRHGELVYQSLAVDLPSGERVLLKGSPSKVVFKGYTRLR